MRNRPPSQGLILLVEDDDALASAVAFALTAEGFEVESFRSGEELLEVARDRDACYLILDQRLGAGLTGLVALETLRHEGIRWPAIIMTTAPAAWLVGRAKAASANVIEKPILGDQLLRLIRRSASGRE